MRSPDLYPALPEKVREKSGQPIELCFQCQKCASGCPMGERADYLPSQIIRMLQLGLTERALQSSSIWLCPSCETCSARCPNGIKIAAVMDVLRAMAVLRDFAAKNKEPVFHRVFLKSIQNRGRVHETLILIQYKLKVRDLFSDAVTGLKMFKRGKLPLFAKKVKNKKIMKRIFAGAAQAQG